MKIEMIRQLLLKAERERKPLYDVLEEIIKKIAEIEAKLDYVKDLATPNELKD